MPLAFRRQWFSDWLRNDLTTLLPKLPITVLAMAAEHFDLSADPEEGEEGERAAASDAFDDARRRWSMQGFLQRLDRISFTLRQHPIWRL